MKTVAVLQPGYLPWLGFFDQLAQSDHFVIYDDVQYDKHGWRNRNRIRTAEGWQWLTVPVLTKGKSEQLVKETEINNQDAWAVKHQKSLEQHYHQSPHFKTYFPIFETVYGTKWDRLIDLNLTLLQKIAEALSIKTPISRASEMQIEGERSERLVKICKALDATTYLSGDAAKDYLDESMFEREGIGIRWHGYQHPVYRQMHEPFIPYLSIVDLLFNHGKESLNVLMSKKGASLCKS